MIDINNTGAIKAAFEGWSARFRRSAKVSVKFTVGYAAKIHEDMAMPHPNGGQAKFLETPMRTETAVMQSIFRQEIKNKQSVERAMVRMADHLLAKAKELVPVRTGRLRDSGKVVVEGGGAP